MNPLEEIQNFLEITPDLLTSGQPTAAQLELIQRSGCAVVINLATPASPDFINDEAKRCRELGLEYIAIPVEWTKPKTEDLKAYFAALNQFTGHKVFVHCARNMRVSAFSYLYRIQVLGVEETVCLADLNKIWQPDETWSRFIADCLSEA